MVTEPLSGPRTLLFGLSCILHPQFPIHTGRTRPIRVAGFLASGGFSLGDYVNISGHESEVFLPHLYISS